MPKVDNTPDTLKPYLSHGVELEWSEGDKNATADCPWCGSPGKFSVLIAKGIWKCWVCGEGEEGGGNSTTFVQKLLKLSVEATPIEDYRTLADERGLDIVSLVTWNIAKSVTTGRWIAPGYTPSGKVVTLYHRTWTGKAWKFIPTPTLGHKLGGLQLPNSNASAFYITEGYFDGIALWEALKSGRRTPEGELVPTSNERNSLLAESAILVIPGVNAVLKDTSWHSLVKDKEVVLMLDSDHPKIRNGKNIAPAGISGVKKLTGVLSSSQEAPEMISYLKWGEDGYDPNLEDGMDISDYLSLEKL